jgi:hydroxyacylglutathione hydrolase
MFSCRSIGFKAPLCFLVQICVAGNQSKARRPVRETLKVLSTFAAKPLISPRIMNLEDNIGDIIRKGRMASKTDAAKAASAAGLSEAELTTIEESGKITKQPNWAALGNAIGMDGGKLQRLANGWKPSGIDVSLWRELRQITTAGDGMTVNCYLVWDEVSRDAALFDTGFDAAPIFKLIDENGLNLKHLFITHLHGDHVAALETIRAKYPKIFMHVNSTTVPPQHRTRKNDFISLGSLRITNRETPGHADEGVTFIVGNWPEDAAHVAIVGDAIFAGSMGGGRDQWDLAKQKVREQILSLPPDTLICPGHGPMTTVAQEKENNPFF